MCQGIALGWRELPELLIARYQLNRRRISRADGTEPEFRFMFRSPRPVLPVWRDSQLMICTWGARLPVRLPRTGWAEQEWLEQWGNLNPEPVDIPANFGLDRGIWYQIKQGIRGILVLDQAKEPHVYLLTEPSSHYYQVMTRSPRMPVLIEERI